MGIKNSKPNKTFKQAVEATDEVQHCFMEGKLAILNKERSKVELTESRKCGGSLFIDDCLINQNNTKTPFYWVQSNGYHILPNSSQERLVIQKGLKPISKLVLK